MSEVALTPETISRFRRSYIEAFGAPSRDDALYAAVSEGRRFAGMEHWLPFYYERLDTLFDYLPDAPFVFDHLAREALAERHTLILDYYEARKKQGEAAGMRDAVPYKPVPPDLLYVSPDEVGERMPDHAAIEFTPFDAPDAEGRRILHAGAKRRPQLRAGARRPVGQRLRRRGEAYRRRPRRRPQGGHRRLDRRLARPAGADPGRASSRATRAGRDAGRRREAEAGAGGRSPCCRSRPASRPAASSSSPSRTFWATGWCAAPSGASAPPTSSPKRPRWRPATSSSTADHGIGRFIGLKTIEAAGAPHDCLEIHYAGDGRLFLPVENIELLSRYGSEATEAVLDRLGGGAWQSRKAKLKQPAARHGGRS